MKYLDEYRNAGQVRQYAAVITRTLSRPWTIMEICGGQTHAIVRFGLDQLLPPELTLVHGPGCPVCVTPIELIDKACALARRPDVIFCSFGDMLRVPGSECDLLSVKADGGDVRIVYSPLEALSLAQANPARQVVFFAVGFETTAPANAMAVFQAAQRKVQNFSLLVSHVLVPPAMSAILSAPESRIQGFLAAGHVCTIMGYRDYEPLAARFHVPIVVTGFEPVDLLQGLLMCVRQLERGQARVENQYARSVRADGNREAQGLIHEVFTIVSRNWRGVGAIPASGLALRDAFACFDAEKRFALESRSGEPVTECVSGMILQGRMKPEQCPAFGGRCTPERPLGAPMVSSEGACAAYFRYRRKPSRQVMTATSEVVS